MTGVDDRLDEPSNEAVEADLMIACAYDPNDAWGEYSSDAMIAAWRAGYQNAQGRLRDAQAENVDLREGRDYAVAHAMGSRANAIDADVRYRIEVQKTDRLTAELVEARAALACIKKLCDDYDAPGWTVPIECLRAAIAGDANPEATDG